MEHLFVTKRDGTQEPVSFDQILQRIRKLSANLDYVNPDLVAQKVCTQLSNNIKTSELDEFAAQTCAMMQSRYHPNYGMLAARILIDNHHKTTEDTLLGCVHKLGESSNLLSDEYYSLVCGHAETYQAMIDYSRDFVFDYFGFKTLERSYLLKKDGKVVERPQHMWMRVAIQLHSNNFPKVKETYDALSHGYFIHATPTLFNSGTSHPQLSSCFLLKMAEDSIDGIFKTLADCAQISKWAGGIGLAIHDIRARGSLIRGTNGESTGIVPMLKVFNDTAKYVNQGGKRNGSFAIYLETWHADIEDFLKLKLNQGAEEDRARDLFYGLWISDLFMQRVENDADWTLMCPSECPGLANCWGEEFEMMYKMYESHGKGRKTLKAKKIWQLILDAQIQTGTPYLCYKDAANSKSNHKHLGTIKSSNLCVAPETWVRVSPIVYGAAKWFQIRDLFTFQSRDGTIHKVWNGNKFSEVTVKKTGEKQKLLKVVVEITTSDKQTLYEDQYWKPPTTKIVYCTEYHKFILPTHTNISECERIDAKDLKSGMYLMGY
jgi:ribonucleotide reductase alpha subunit